MAPAKTGTLNFLDTHAWIWWVTDDSRLSSTAARLIEKASSGPGVWISAISVWEVAKKVEKQQLTLDRPIHEWIDSALSAPGLLVAELSPKILVESCRLPQPFHGDPADQMIVASVRHHRGRLVTRDRKIRGYPHVGSVW